MNGDVRLHKLGGLRIAGSTITGDVKSDRPLGARDPLSFGANVICNTTIGGDLRLRAGSAAAPWRLGSCGPNTVAGVVRVDSGHGRGHHHGRHGRGHSSRGHEH